jgi:hypothetical protein
MNANHTACYHVNTAAANAMCDSLKNPVMVAFEGSHTREAVVTGVAESKLRAEMDRRYDSKNVWRAIKTTTEVPMRRLTTRQLLNHFSNYPDVRIDYNDGTNFGPWNVHSIYAHGGDWVVALVHVPGTQSGPGQLFRIPLSDLDTMMWDIFSS